MPKVIAYSLALAVVGVIVLLARTTWRQLGRAVRAFDLAWELVFNNTAALGQEEQHVVRVVKERFSKEEIAKLKSELKTQEEASLASRDSKVQLACLRRAIMTEADCFKLEEAYLELVDEDSRKLLEQDFGDSLSESSAARIYFAARFKFTVLRYIAFFRYDDVAPNDWYAFYSVLCANRQRAFARGMNNVVRTGSAPVEGLLLAQWDKLMEEWKERLLVWPPRTQVPDELSRGLKTE